MRFLIVSLDKQQYFRPVELGAAQCLRGYSVAEGQGPHARAWLVFLAHLLESPPNARLAGRLGPWYGAWAGDRVAVVRGDGGSGRFLPEDVLALNALGAKVKDYQFLRDEYTDLTAELEGEWPKVDGLWNARYSTATRPSNWDWLTREEAGVLLERARGEGADYYRGYLDWLLANCGLRPEVQLCWRARPRGSAGRGEGPHDGRHRSPGSFFEQQPRPGATPRPVIGVDFHPLGGRHFGGPRGLQIE